MNKKLLMFLALNAIASTFAMPVKKVENKSSSSLYKSITENIEKNKSNSKNYKLIENILNKRNKELKDLYAQNDYVIKPEYLEWQVFFSLFYSDENRGGEKFNEFKTADREAKSLNLGIYVPVREIENFSINRVANFTPVIVDNTVPIKTTARSPEFVNAVKPEIDIDITIPSLQIAPVTVEEKDINLITSLEAPQVPLNDVKVFNLKLNIQSNPKDVTVTGNKMVSTGEVLTSSSAYDIGFRAENNYIAYLVGNSSIERQNASVISVYHGVAMHGTTTNPNASTSLRESNVAGIAVSPNNVKTSFYKTHEWTAYNYGTITGEQKTGGGIYTKQIGFGYIPSGSSNIQVRMNNYGTITMKSPNSAGFLLMPDVDLDYNQDGKKPSSAVAPRTSYDGGYTYTDNDYDQKNVRFFAQSLGTIDVYGSRSYGMMTSPYAGNDMGYNFGISTYGSETSSIINKGTINVLGDEATGFAIKKAIHSIANYGVINIGTIPSAGTFIQDNTNGNTIYDESGNLVSVGDINKIERATGMYTSQAIIDYAIAFDDPSTTAIQIFEQNRRGGSTNYAEINIWDNAVESSGLRAEGEGSVTNVGDISIYGDNNYGIVARDNGSVRNMVNSSYNVGVYDSNTGKWHVAAEGGQAAEITVNSQMSAAGYVDKGATLENSAIITINNDNSAGFYVRSGTATNNDRTSQPLNYGYGSITADGKGSHGVLVTNEDGTTAKFTNNGLIETKYEGTVALYGVNGAQLSNINKNEKERHFLDDGTGVAVTAANWLAQGETFDTSANCGRSTCYLNVYSKVVEVTDFAQNALIKAGDGGTGIWLEQSRGIFTPAAPVSTITSASIYAAVETGNSTADYTAIGIYSDGIAKAVFYKDSYYDPVNYPKEMASVKVGESGIALLHNYRDRIGITGANKNFGGSSGIFNIKALKADLGKNSVLGYSNSGTITTDVFSNVEFTSLGDSVTFAYVSNNGDININDTYLTDFLINPNGAAVGQDIIPFIAENGIIKNSVTDSTTGSTGISGLVMNTKIGLQSFSKDNTAAALNKSKTASNNYGTITMTGRSNDGAMALYSKYGNILNDLNGKINLSDKNSAGFYAIEETDAVNKGIININGDNSVGMYGLSEDSVNPAKNGLSGISLIQDGSAVINVNSQESAGIYGINLRSIAGKSYIINNSGLINVKDKESIGIYSENVKVTGIGTINLGDTTLSTTGDRTAIYAKGQEALVTTTGAVIKLGTANQTNIAYYITENAGLTGSNLGNITGYGIIIAGKNTEISNSKINMNITGGNGQIGLAILGTNNYSYTGDISVGDTVVNGTDKYYGVAMYTGDQNISSTISNKLTAGANGVGLYAGGNTGSTLTYNGEITVGNGTAAGTGIFVKSGSEVTLASGGKIHLVGVNGVGVYVEGNGEFTFGSGSSMVFDGSGIGIWGDNGSVINDNGTGTISSSAGAFVIRSRLANGVLNINAPGIVLGNGSAGYVVNGEINNLSGSTLVTNPSSDNIIALIAEGYKTVGTNTYEANNFGKIDLTNSSKGIAVYLKNARGINETAGMIILGNEGVGLYGEGNSAIEHTELRNSGQIQMNGSNSQALYGKGAALIENNGAVISGTSKNTGIYSVYDNAVNTKVNNFGTINLGNGSFGIYGENSDITNTGNIEIGDTSGSDYSVGIYAKDSTVTNSGNIKTGQGGTAFVGDNSIINLNGGNFDVSNGSLLYGKNNTVINYKLADQISDGAKPYINLENSVLNVLSPAVLNVKNSSVGIFITGNTGAVNGDITINAEDSGNGIYVKNLGTVYTNNTKININGTSAKGLVLENTSADNTGILNVNSTGTGIFSQLTSSGNVTVKNNGIINVNSSLGTGIYASSENTGGILLGTTTVDNDGTITLGNSSDVNSDSQIGIFGTAGTKINNNSVINGGSNVIGIYGTDTITTNGSIVLGDGSAGVYLNGGSLVTGSNTLIKVGAENAVAIYAANGAAVTNNSSDIHAGKDSVLVYVQDAGTMVNNLADLNVGEKGIGFYSDKGTANNSARISGSGSDAVFFYAKNGEVNNSGLLDAAGNTGVIGIYGENSKIMNNGDMILGDSIINPNDITQSTYAIGIYGKASEIKNTGNIKLGANSVGIYSDGNTTDAENTGLIESTAYGAMGIFIENGTFKNNGRIILSGDDSVGMAGRRGAAIINDGQIIINGKSGIGMYVTDYSYVYNNGVITINGDNGTGIQIGTNSILENEGTINLNGLNGQSVLYGESTRYQLPSIINAGIINVNEKFETNGVNVIVKVDPSTVRKPEASEMTGSDYELSDINGKFLVSNAVQFNAPSFDIEGPVTITNSFSQGTNATAYKLENVFNPLTPYGGLNTNKISVISDSFTWDAIPVISDSGGVTIWMQKLDYKDLSKNKWYSDFSGALDQKYTDAKGNALKIYDKIDNIKTAEEFDHIMGSLGGNVYANINQREEDIAEIFENSLYLLQDSKNNTKENVKINVIAGKGRTKEDTDGIEDYTYETAGVLALREVERTYRHTFGYSLGYLHTSFEMDDNNSSEEWADTLQIGGHNKYSADGWTLRNDITGRASMHNIDRNINWSDGISELNGSYETYSITSDNKLAKEIVSGKNINISPYAGFKLMYVTRPTFQEDGLEALEVEGNDAWSAKPRAGIEVKVSGNESKSGWKLKGALDIAYEYELADFNNQESARLIAVEDAYHNLAKAQEEKGLFKTRAIIGTEIEDRYGIFLNGEYSMGERNQSDYKVGVMLKAVF
ncbi:autotransporter domain-containing protein [Sebaldella sp. S0638]|uniref:autotransporter domain-containing protein n=1 Tax=Sebaldella sp. S0638 TaxID=2957809 RepID=UPI00209CEFF4|nr:autotransporter domain-containing protein [Sebaldella sp. S0638]MCP1226046.1 hypothetical protein [Sebaldella sp. S0638]